MARTLYKVSVPRASVTNFLHGFGCSDESIPMPPQTLALMKTSPTLPGLSARGAADWMGNVQRDVHHAKEWNPHKARGPLRMYFNARPGISPGEQVLLMVYVDDSDSTQAVLYFDYCRMRR